MSTLLTQPYSVSPQVALPQSSSSLKPLPRQSLSKDRLDTSGQNIDGNIVDAEDAVCLLLCSDFNHRKSTACLDQVRESFVSALTEVLELTENTKLGAPQIEDLFKQAVAKGSLTEWLKKSDNFYSLKKIVRIRSSELFSHVI